MVRKRKPTKPVAGGLGRAMVNARDNTRRQFIRTARADHEADATFEHPAAVATAMSQASSSKPVVDSVTEETGLEEFLAKAQLANRTFEADREHSFIVNADTGSQLVSQRRQAPVDVVLSAEMQLRFADRLRIPRRPSNRLWSDARELIEMENKAFLEWRQNIADLQEVDGVTLTPFERNVELWRQLWRVVERSDIVVQILDARNPLLFRSQDLEKYVKEVDPNKVNLLLANKSDMLSSAQLESWRRYFAEAAVETVFWTALPSSDDDEQVTGEAGLLTPESLVEYLKSVGYRMNISDRPLVVGMVGYPNVGKSSTINRLLGRKKVSVSTTPGKTKHFQTLNLDDELTLCDCPGLVMPSFSLSKEAMVLNGILPIHQLTNYRAPVALLCTRIPRRRWEHNYGIMLPRQRPENSTATDVEDLLTCVAFMRGFMSSNGVPDYSRAARLILNDVVNGKLKWLSAPPNVSQAEFEGVSAVEMDVIPEEGALDVPHDRAVKKTVVLEQIEKRHLLTGPNVEDLDRGFFGSGIGAAHVKGIKSMPAAGDKRHHKKKDKTRRLYGHLDA